MDETCAGTDAKVHATLSATDVDILDFGALGEVLDDGSTIEDRVDGQTLGEVAGHIAQDNVDALAEERLEGIGEIVEEQGAQTIFGLFERLAAYEAIDIGRVGVDELAQDVDAQITRGTRDEHVAERTTFALTEGIERIVLQ